MGIRRTDDGSHEISRGCLLAIAASLCLSAAAPGEDLQSAVGRLCQGVQGDDAKAAKLVAATAQGDVSEELANGLLKLAADLAVKSADSSTGLQAGIDAIDALIRKAPSQAAYYRTRLELLCQEAYRRAKPQAKVDTAADVMKRLEAAGDVAAGACRWEDAEGRYAIALRMAGMSGHTQVLLDGKLRMARHYSAALRQVKAAEASAGTGDKSANGRLGMLYLTDLNDPGKAWALLKADSGEVLRTCIPLAMKDAGELHNDALILLCDWYWKSLAPKTEDFGRELMLRQARRYAGLVQGEENNGAAAPAQTEPDRTKGLDEQLAGYSYVGRMLAKNRFLDLLAMTDIDRDASNGKWKYAENSFMATGEDNGSLKLPVQVEGSYQLTLQLAKTKAAQDVYVSFPVGGKQLKLHLAEYSLANWGRGGLGMVGGQDAQGPLLAQAGRGGGGRGGGLGGRWPGGLEGLRNAIWMRAELLGARNQEGSSIVHEIDPQYDKRTWVPYDINISVSITDAKAAVAVSVTANHKVAWSGDISSIGNIDPEPAPITIRFTKAGLAVRSIRLVPRGAARYAYDDRPTAMAALPAAEAALPSQTTPTTVPATTQPKGK